MRSQIPGARSLAHSWRLSCCLINSPGNSFPIMALLWSHVVRLFSSQRCAYSAGDAIGDMWMFRIVWVIDSTGDAAFFVVVVSVAD